MRVFLDASVLFSGVYSDVGGSRELLRQAMAGDLQLVTSSYVLEEARRSIQKTAPELLGLHDEIVAKLPGHLETVPDPPPKQVRSVARYVAAKDAPIVAAALSAHVDCLVTLDRRHLLQDRVRTCSGLCIVTPGELLSRYRGMRSDE